MSALCPGTLNSKCLFGIDNLRMLDVFAYTVDHGDHISDAEFWIYINLFNVNAYYNHKVHEAWLIFYNRN